MPERLKESTTHANLLQEPLATIVAALLGVDDPWKRSLRYIDERYAPGFEADAVSVFKVQRFPQKDRLALVGGMWLYDKKRVEASAQYDLDWSVPRGDWKKLARKG